MELVEVLVLVEKLVLVDEVEIEVLVELVRDQLLVLEGAGLQRIILQWLNLDDLVGLESLAKAVL